MGGARTLKFRLSDEEATGRFGVALGRALPEGAVLSLQGDLGAGKTTLARAICQGLGVEELDQVTSPTFTLLNEYAGRCPIAHFDFYRVESINSLPELGVDEALDARAIILAEWSEKFPGALPPERNLVIGLEHSTEDPDLRLVEVTLPQFGDDAEAWRAVIELLEANS